MKILNLKFKNINSLSGENEIDFTLPLFTHEGLFAITGKTGAGKSSILDAISLALYGKTPRVEITGVENAVMTRGEKDCYAEIVFEVSGKKWKSSWKQERARTGTLKQVERVIADENNQIVADKISIKGERKSAEEKTVNEKIIEILGLTFEQFTKVILLAQGSFAAFLQARQNEKGELLEQITGTEIYGKVSETVFEKNRIEKEKLEKINLELQAIRVLSQDEIQNITTEITLLEEETKKLEREIQHIESAKNWVSEIQQLKLQLQNITQKLPELEKIVCTKKGEWEHSTEKLKNAKEQYRMIEPTLIKVRELDIKILEKEKLLQPILKNIHELEQAKNTSTETLENKTQEINLLNELLTQKKNWETNNLKLENLASTFSVIEKEKQLLDQTITENNKLTIEAIRLHQISEKLRLKAENAIQLLQEKEESLKKKQFEQESLKMELFQILNGGKLTDVQLEKEQLTFMIVQFEKLIDIEHQVLTYHNTILEIDEKIEVWKKEIEEKSTQKKQENERLALFENEIRLIEENIHLAKRVQSLEEQRNHLKDGEPCPLCGSIEHPYASGNTPQIGEKEEELIALKANFQSKTLIIQQIEQQLAKIMADIENGIRNIEIGEQQKALLIAKRVPIIEGIQRVSPDLESKELRDIQFIGSQMQHFQEKMKRIQEIIAKGTTIENSIVRLRDKEIPHLIQEKQDCLQEKNEAETAQKLSEQQEEAHKKLIEIGLEKQGREQAILNQKFQHYDVDHIEKLKMKLESWLENRKMIECLSDQINQIKTEITLQNNEKENILHIIKEKKTEKESIEKEKQNLVTERRDIFGDQEVEDVAFRLKNEVVTQEEIHERLVKEHQSSVLELGKSKAIHEKIVQELNEKEKLKITESSSEELQEKLDKSRILKEQLLQELGGYHQTLKTDSENLKVNGKKIKEKEHQQLICNKWEKLNLLIGSADGKKYRNFAQALTFEHLIGISNKQLQKMSDRYILKRSSDATNPFELLVIDQFQNNEERTAQNLSGGEKFIVSLSLALGLANMASKNMSIDTMFIDEGFGTLDSDYLDVALNALSNLQSEGKIIGVISHLTELKERIATHIEVVPSGNGHSKIRIG